MGLPCYPAQIDNTHKIMWVTEQKSNYLNNFNLSGHKISMLETENIIMPLTTQLIGHAKRMET